jgi:Replication-relaxation
VLRFLLWRVLGLLSAFAGLGLLAWFLAGGPGRVLRGEHDAGTLHSIPGIAGAALAGVASSTWAWSPAFGVAVAPLLISLTLAGALLLIGVRCSARARRRYVRLVINAYRTDHAEAEDLVRMFEALHKHLLRRWWRRLALGQPSIAMEVHHTGGNGGGSAWLGVSCPRGLERVIEAALQAAYPNCRVSMAEHLLGAPPVVLRLKKQAEFIRRGKSLPAFERDRQPTVDRLLTVMATCGEPVFVQIALTPTAASFESLARHLFKRREADISRERREHLFIRDRSMVLDAELRGGLDVQHRPLYFADLRVVAPSREVCERVAAQLRVETAENRLVERGTAVRHGLLGIYGRRVQRGEGNPVPSFRKGVFAATELASLWQLPSVDYATVPFARSGVPIVPAPPGIFRPRDGRGTLHDAHGPVSIHEDLRRQNTAVPGAVEQGKSSYLVATIAEDVRRERCALIVLDPKGDAADAALSVIPSGRVCTLLDFANPSCGFNPLAVDAPADVIADYVVAALKNLFTDADIRASSDRYLRNAIIAVLAHDRGATLWDAARLLSVGEEGYAYRSSVGSSIRSLPEFKEISEFFTAELTAQLADSRSTTTAKLDAPVNKLARLLNSASIKRVLLNDSLRVDFDRVIAGEEVLIVKGALGAMGAGNTSVLMQLLIGMLDAALARQQDLVTASQRVAVALKIDEAPLVINRGFAETMALKRSAGLETVACWQTDAQWIDRDVREQLDALFAHRVYFATSSARDARSAVNLTMSEFSDSVRPGLGRLSSLGRPDARLHLPKHHAIASWSTQDGRQSAFIAQTLPLQVDPGRLHLHAVAQHRRGGRPLRDLRQPHWERARDEVGGNAARVEPPTEVKERPQSARARSGGGSSALPSIPAEGYRELVELDRAQTARRASPAPTPVPLEPDRADIEMLSLTAALGHVLSSQLHRRVNPKRSFTTTQRRLKRLADAGLVERFQFHRRDGGGVPMCYAITAEGLRVLDSLSSSDPDHEQARSPAPTSTPLNSERRLRQARHDIHVAGWALALAGVLGTSFMAVRGAEESVLPLPRRPGGGSRAGLSLAELRLPGGRVPHDFLTTDSTGRGLEVEHFETLRPDALLELSFGIDLILERDDRLETPQVTAKLERYDHFLTGWSTHTRRYGRRAKAHAMVIYICRDRARARACARGADSVLRASRAYAGEYPFDWEYQGREGIVFVSERDIYEGVLLAYGVPRLPPGVRVAAAQGDPRAGESMIRECELPRDPGQAED